MDQDSREALTRFRKKTKSQALLQKELTEAINNLAISYNEQLMVQIQQMMKPGKYKWKINKIINFIYKGLEGSYNLSLSHFKKNDWLKKDFELKDLDDLTYKKDNKTIEDRIQYYIDKAKDFEKNNISNLDIQIYLFNMISRILENEMQVLRWGLYSRRCLETPWVIFLGICTCSHKEGRQPDAKDEEHNPLWEEACSRYSHIWKQGEAPDLPIHPSCSCSILPLDKEEVEVLIKCFPETNDLSKIGISIDPLTYEINFYVIPEEQRKYYEW